jgi:hypothetical protein
MMPRIRSSLTDFMTSFSTGGVKKFFGWMKSDAHALQTPQSLQPKLAHENWRRDFQNPTPVIGLCRGHSHTSRVSTSTDATLPWLRGTHLTQVRPRACFNPVGEKPSPAMPRQFPTGLNGRGTLDDSSRAPTESGGTLPRLSGTRLAQVHACSSFALAGERLPPAWQD